MSRQRTTTPHSTTPSPSTTIGSKKRSARSVRGPLSSFGFASLMVFWVASASVRWRATPPVLPRPFSMIPRGDRARERLGDQPAVAGVVGRGAEALVARIGRLDGELGEDPARSRRHYHDALREVDR